MSATTPRPQADPQLRITGRNALTVLWSLSSGNRRLLITCIVLSVTASGAMVAQPRVVQTVVNRLFVEEPLGLAAYLLVAVTTCSVLVAGLQGYLMQRTAESVALRLRRQLTNKYLKMTVAEHDHGRTADLLSRAVNDTNLVKQMISAGIVPVLGSVVTLIAVVVLMITVSLSLFLIALTFVVVGALLVSLVGGSARVSSLRVQDSTAGFGVAIERMLTSIRTVKAFRAEPVEQRNADASAHELWEAGVRLARLQALVQPALNLCLYGCLLTVIILGTTMMSSGDLDIGGFAAFLMYMFMLIAPVASLGQAYAQVQIGMAAVLRLREMQHLPEEAAQPATAPALVVAAGTGEPPLLSLRGVGLSYEDGTAALDQVDLDVRRGERIGVVGMSGAGKSSLLELLERFYEPDQGQILLDGVDYTTTDPVRYRERIAYIPQDCHVITGTLRENLTMGRDVDEADLLRVVRRLGLESPLGKAAFGLDSDLGQAGVTLSGGQRQRIAWARVLLSDADVILLDEPTSSLDAITERLVQELLAEECAGRTVITVSHRPSTVRDCDRVVLMEHGRVLATGRHPDLLLSSPVYRRLMETDRDLQVASA